MELVGLPTRQTYVLGCVIYVMLCYVMLCLLWSPAREGGEGAKFSAGKTATGTSPENVMKMD